MSLICIFLFSGDVRIPLYGSLYEKVEYGFIIIFPLFPLNNPLKPLRPVAVTVISKVSTVLVPVNSGQKPVLVTVVFAIPINFTPEYTRLH